MKNARNLAQKLLAAADFPGEILTGVPVVEIKGDSEAVVISHRGVISYDESSVRIASALGELWIEGDGLTVFRMNRERIVLHGSVRRVSVGAQP